MNTPVPAIEQAAQYDLEKRRAPESRGIRKIFFRSVWLPALVTTVLLLIALGLLLSISWHSLERLQPVQNHRALVSRIENTGLNLEQILVESLSKKMPVNEKTLDQLRAQIFALGTLDSHLAPGTPARIKKIQELLSDVHRTPQSKAVDTLRLMRGILVAEIHAHDKLIARVYRDTEFEFRVVLGIIIAFPLLALLTLFFLRHRILLPLNNLRSLMTMLAQQDYSAAPLTGVDPMLRPLFENYNHLVGRLSQLEDARKARQETLENEVRAATQVLLAQQQNLASAERLAAVGEVAAGLAHELRNPLAAILMTLGNLRNEMATPDQTQRFDLVIAELKRLTRLLNNVLSDARQAPEPTRTVMLARVVDELLALARYQLPRNVHVECNIANDLICRLPEDRLRQALLNLILNSAKALDQHPGTVRVTAAFIDRRLRLDITDDGPGFSRELLDAGVRPFVTGHDQGTGLGLAIVRRFVADVGGELRFANRAPNGACVTMDLPCGELQYG